MDSKQCAPTALLCYPNEGEEKRGKVMAKEKAKQKEKAKEVEILGLKSTGNNFVKTTRCFVMPRLAKRVAAVTGIRWKLVRHHLTAKVDVGAILALIFAPTSLINSWQRAKEKAKDMEREKGKAKAKEIWAKLTVRSFAKTTRCCVTPRPAKQAAAAIGTHGKQARLHSTVKAAVGVILAPTFAPISRIKYNRKLNTNRSNSANLQDLGQDLVFILSAKTHSKIHLEKTLSTLSR